MRERLFFSAESLLCIDSEKVRRREVNSFRGRRLRRGKSWKAIWARRYNLDTVHIYEPVEEEAGWFRKMKETTPKTYEDPASSFGDEGADWKTDLVKLKRSVFIHQVSMYICNAVFNKFVKQIWKQHYLKPVFHQNYTGRTNRFWA